MSLHIDSKYIRDNPFTKAGTWHKANLHTHTTNSDGMLSPEDTARRYAEAGYGILAITDHDKFTPVDSIATNGLVMIPAAELHPQNSTNPFSKWHHLVCLGLRDEPKMIKATHVQDVIDSVTAQGAMVIAGHPYWLKQSIDDLRYLRGISGMEVYNTTCGEVGRESSDQIWDDYCLRVTPIFGLATDDCHFTSSREFAGAWMWVKTQVHDLAGVMAALWQGDFYSSTGPEIMDIQVSPSEPDPVNWQGIQIDVKCSPARSVAFIAPHAGRQVFAEDGEMLERATAVIGPEIKYVRVEVRGDNGKTAWSNPIVFDSVSNVAGDED